MLLHVDIGEQINDITKLLLIKFRTGKVLGKHSLQPWVFVFNEYHCVVNDLSDFRGMSSRGNNTPSGILRDKEDVLRCIFVLIFLHAISFSNKVSEFLFKPVRNVFQENKPEDYMFVFGSIHTSPQ